jgi:diguanylate cyclase (GGDEF)-like protein
MDKERLLEYREKELRILKNLNRLIGSTENLDILLARVSGIIKSEIKSKYTFFIFKKSDGYEIKSYDINKELREDFVELLFLITNDIAKRAGFVLINNTKKHKRLRSFGIQNLLATCLTLYSEILGAIITIQKPNGFSKFDLRLLNSIANQVAIAVDQIRTKRKLEERERKVTELYAKLYKREAKKAIRDQLTSLYNKSFFIEKLEKLMKEKNVCLIMFDVDHFKNYNDLYGHLAGDELLIRIAEKIKEIMEKYGVENYVCRYGGEEFGIVINADIDLATEIAERIREGIENLYYERKAKRLVTASFGVGVSKKNEKVRDFIDRVDKLLYKAKQLGRNLVCRE